MARLKTILLYLLALVLLCLPARGAGKPRSQKVTIMSFNIRFVTAKDTSQFSWYKRRGPVVKMIEDIRPDVISLQEHGPQWIEYLQSKLPFYDFYIPDLSGEDPLPKGYSQVIVWQKEKYEKVDAGRFFLSDTPDSLSKGWGSNHYRNTGWVKLRSRKTGIEFYVFNTHLDHKAVDAKKNGVLLNVEMMKRIAGEDAAVFIMGDMNMRRGSKTGAFLDPYYEWMESTADAARKVYRNVTFNAYGDTAHQAEIDFIFFRNADAIRYEVIDSPDYGVEYISDHWPIIGKYILNN